MKVWVSESGEYSQRGVNGVFASIQAGVDATIQSCQPEPKYQPHFDVVDTRVVVNEKDQTATLTIIYRNGVESHYDFEPYELIGARPDTETE